tara:strand:- start:32 stop:412 length:381 start_codon:yes stop_codon:yes gene_type:complete
MKEAELFEYLLENHYPDLVKAKKKMSRWDCYSPNTFHRIELKCRATHYDTLILERKKYDAMLLKCDDNLDIPIYINSTPKGVYSFNLFKIEPKWEIKYLKKTTTFTNNNQIAKEIAMLPVIDAEIL